MALRGVQQLIERVLRRTPAKADQNALGPVEEAPGVRVERSLGGNPVSHYVLPTLLRRHAGAHHRLGELKSATDAGALPFASLRYVLCHHFVSDYYCATPGFLSVWTCDRLGMVQPPIPASHLSACGTVNAPTRGRPARWWPLGWW